jgi:hypothetical protein
VGVAVAVIPLDDAIAGSFGSAVDAADSHGWDPQQRIAYRLKFQDLSQIQFRASAGSVSPASAAGLIRWRCGHRGL